MTFSALGAASRRTEDRFEPASAEIRLTRALGFPQFRNKARGRAARDGRQPSGRCMGSAPVLHPAGSGPLFNDDEDAADQRNVATMDSSAGAAPRCVGELLLCPDGRTDARRLLSTGSTRPGALAHASRR
jgi:hypothetical protein